MMSGSSILRKFFGPETDPDVNLLRDLKRSHLIPRWIFLRALGLIYFSAFYSLLFQIRGLIGPDGILPAHQYLQAVDRSLLGGADRVLVVDEQPCAHGFYHHWADWFAVSHGKHLAASHSSRLLHL